jgi:hypothetical protein
MTQSSITFSDVDTKLKGNPRVACHVHFPPCPKVVSFPSIQKPIFFEVPKTATAVCATLVWRFGKGWLPHGRCRFSLIGGSETQTIKHETTLIENGSATLAFNGAIPVAPRRGVLLREWFWVPTEFEVALTNARDLSKAWYTSRTAEDQSIENVHMPYWNNKADSIPGWFFAFDLPRKCRYNYDDFAEVFTLAKNTVLGDGTGTAIDNLALMAFGLTMFGLSISYTPDIHYGSGHTIERFSSNARLDGIGDCEDIAKEVCMAHADLCKLSESTFRTLEFVTLKTAAKSYTSIIVIGTIRRPSNEMQAHAFCMLVPNEYFDTDDRPVYRETLLCDGTYPCYPTANGVDWQRPWTHELIVSALVMGQGEIYFEYENDDSKYGVKFEDFFPRIKSNVTHVYSNERTSEAKRMANVIVASNLPIQARTLDFEDQSIASRFLNMWSERSGDLAKFKTKGGHVSTDEFMNCAPFEGGLWESLADANERYTEVAFVNGAISNVGVYGSVDRLFEPGAVAGHSHHRVRGEDYRKFNPPTPSDLKVFVRDRVLSKLHRTMSRKTETVFTHNYLYEITDFGKAGGLVSVLLSKYRMQKNEPTDDEVSRDVNLFFSENGLTENSKGSISKVVSEQMFEEEKHEQAYISFLENFEGLGLKIRRIKRSAIESQCKFKQGLAP